MVMILKEINFNMKVDVKQHNLWASEIGRQIKVDVAYLFLNMNLKVMPFQITKYEPNNSIYASNIEKAI